MKVAFVCDSGSGVDQKTAEQYGLKFLPLQYTFGEKSVLEGVETTIDEVYDNIEAGVEITTSLSPLGIITELLENLKSEGYDKVMCFPITSGLSSNAATIQMTAQQVGIEFDYLDCYMPAVIQVYAAILAKQMYENGQDLDDIKEKLEAMVDSAATLVVPDNMDQLAKSGRLTPLAAKLSGLLKIKPVLILNKESAGKVEVFDKVRTSKKAFAKMLEKAEQDIEGDGEGYFIGMEDARNHQDGQYIMELLKQRFPKAQFFQSNLVGVVSVHTGLGCVGIQYFKLPQ